MSTAPICRRRRAGDQRCGIEVRGEGERASCQEATRKPGSCKRIKSKHTLSFVGPIISIRDRIVWSSGYGEGRLEVRAELHAIRDGVREDEIQFALCAKRSATIIVQR